jgi:Two component regulator propeller
VSQGQHTPQVFRGSQANESYDLDSAADRLLQESISKDSATPKLTRSTRRIKSKYSLIIPLPRTILPRRSCAMKLVRFAPLFFVIMIVLLTPLLSIDAQNRIDTWTTDNGLPQNSVTGLTQTPDGYIWFTTNDGLVRFDGVRFKVFNKSSAPEITNNRQGFQGTRNFRLSPRTETTICGSEQIAV